MSYIKLPYKNLKFFSLAVFKKMGFSKKSSEIITDVLLTSDLYGIESHGMQRMILYYKSIKSGNTNPLAQPEIVFETPISAVIDNHLGAGQTGGFFAMNTAIKKAKESLLKHSSSLEFSFIKNHTNSIIANNGVKRTKVIEELETKSLEDVIIKSIFFIANDDIYLKSDYEQKILNSFGNIETIKAKSLEMIMIFFPVLSKEGFLKYFSKRLEENE